MKYTLFLLAAMVGAVCGAHLTAEIQGITPNGDPCATEVEEDFFDDCVEGEAAAMGFDFSSRRLELRGNRELGTGSLCGLCFGRPTIPGSWCVVICGNRRRLTIADEHVHTERFLTSLGQLQEAANECLNRKVTEGYTCLGNPEDLEVQISLSDLLSENAPIDLGTAGNYAILAKTGISTVPASSIIGNIAVSPIASTAITGFGLIMDSSGMFSTATQVSGNVYAPTYTSPTPSDLTTAVGDMETAYTDAAARPTTGANLNLGGGAIGGETLTPGVYTFDVDISIGAATQVYFSGSPTDVFILQTTGSVVQSANTNVILMDGAQAKNIFWQVAGEITVGAGAHMEGVLLVKTAVNFLTGSSLVGRVLAQTACTLQSADIVEAVV